MMMDIDAVGSDFEEPESDEAPKKKSKSTRKAAAPAKKTPAKGKGKKKVVGAVSDYVAITFMQVPLSPRVTMMTTMTMKR